MKRMGSTAGCVILLLCLLTGCGGAAPAGDDAAWVCIRQTDSDGSYITFDYDADGNETRSSNYSVDDRLLGWTEYSYENGQKTGEITYFADGVIQSRSRIKYDGERLVKWIYQDKNGREQAVQTFTYEGDRVIKETCTDDTGSVWYSFDYDAQGNETARILHETADEAESALTIRNEYGTDGSMRRTATLIGETLLDWSEMEYDAKGRLIRRTSYDSADRVQSVTQSSYDKHGNLTETTVSGFGSADMTTSYTYCKLSEYLAQQEADSEEK